MSVIISGASDDLIEIDGEDGSPDEEFSCPEQEALLAFSDGTALLIKVDGNGVWRITPEARGTATLTVDQAPTDDDRNYSDRATLDGPITWVVLGTEIAIAGRPTG